MADIKNFLYAWCGKKKLTPNYDIRAAGNKNRQKFMCEVSFLSLLNIWLTVLSYVCSVQVLQHKVKGCWAACLQPVFYPKHSSVQVRVDGFNYIGMGNSTNKKDAQTNAARDFVNYLVRIGEMSTAEVPAVGVSTRFPLFFKLWDKQWLIISGLKRLQEPGHL